MVIKETSIIGFVLILLGLSFVSAGVAPVTSIDYFTNYNLLDDKVICENGMAYLNYDDVVFHGKSEAMNENATIDIIKLSLDGASSGLAFCGDNSTNCNEKTIYWDTSTFFNIIEGNHIIRAKAFDNQNNREEFSENNTCEFCIDKSSPFIDEKPIIIREDICEGGNPNYINSEREEVKFDLNGMDEGCAGINYYEFEIKLNNDTLNGTVKGNELNVGSFFNLIDGDVVRVRALPVDNAGNKGEWSDWSDEVYIDNNVPEVEITNENADVWIGGNLSITETDNDENLNKCYIKVKVVNGETTIDWMETACNEPFTIDTTEVCLEDGKNKCWVHKKAVDLACNEKSVLKEFDIDNKGPVIERFIFGKNYENETDNFVKTDSEILIVARDEGAGIEKLCYSVDDGNESCENVNENESIESLNFTIRFDSEGKHILYVEAGDVLGHEVSEEQIYFVDDSVPETESIFSGFFEKIEEWFGIENFVKRWIGPATAINLISKDRPEGSASGVNKTEYRILKQGSGNETEWYGLNDGKWYSNESECEEANFIDNGVAGEGNDTGEDNNQSSLMEESNCVSVGNWGDVNGGTHIYFDNVSYDFNGKSDAYKICYNSEDNLGNQEKEKCEVFFVDSNKPNIGIVSPLGGNNINIDRCVQSIVAVVNDDKTGVKEVKAELWNMERDEKVRDIKLELSDTTNTYEGLMDLQLPAGDYSLKIIAEDNAGNILRDERNETLNKSVFVEFISPSSCLINPETGGECNFKFNVCMRDANKISMRISPLGDLLTPTMMDAIIKKDDEMTFVGLAYMNGTFINNAGILTLSNEIINGRTSFDLSLRIPANISGAIGEGAHKLQYWFESYK